MLVGRSITKSPTTVCQGANVRDVVDHMLPNWVSGRALHRHELRTDRKRSWLVISTGLGHAFAECVHAHVRPADETFGQSSVFATARLTNPFNCRGATTNDCVSLETQDFPNSLAAVFLRALAEIREIAEWRRSPTWLRLWRKRSLSANGFLRRHARRRRRVTGNES